MNTRSLKIELAGDIFRRKTYPKIRLQGQWLARLGFIPDARAQGGKAEPMNTNGQKYESIFGDPISVYNAPPGNRGRRAG